MAGKLLIVLGNQLFPLHHLTAEKDATVFMAEDLELCTNVRHHQQKIVLFLAAMRTYRDQLTEQGWTVHYCELDDSGDSYEEKLRAACEQIGCNEIKHFEVEDRFMEVRLADFASAGDYTHTVMTSPMFLCERERFADYLGSVKRPFMADFYKRERKRLGILMDEGEPAGGQWSYDADNRKKLPRKVTPPSLAPATATANVQDVQKIVAARFAEHPGSAQQMWWPTTRDQALQWLNDFIAERLALFGDYEDAMTTRSTTLFHSALSPVLNLGLITPAEVIEHVLAAAREQEIPLNSLEGFVRQVIGWREFVRGIYQNFGEQQEASNHWHHTRRLTTHWYDGTTGIVPLDDTIQTALKLGWTHHIPRLMVAGNLMTLCEINPRDAYRWFMEMYVDSSDWVMGPNVYGMGLFSDGGIFATKPYICGSNYLRKMSDYPGGDWCDVVDGLYWRFVAKHLEFFKSNPRLAMMTRALDRLKAERRTRIFSAAEEFIEKFTRAGES